tara:strand:- start:52 stop:228 length:177 start_codon:yes stop_codon:yes gene_type:complete
MTDPLPGTLYFDLGAQEAWGWTGSRWVRVPDLDDVLAVAVERLLFERACADPALLDEV